MSKELREVVRKVTEAGLQVRFTRKQHLQVLREGRVIAGFAGTPSDWRSWRNSVAALRRAGVQL